MLHFQNIDLCSFLQYNAVKIVGGESGNPLDEEVQKVFMRSICGTILAEQFQTKMTWTGKTNIKTVRKIALKSHKKVVELIFLLAAAADKTIDSKKGKNLVIYEVLKNAYRKAIDDSHVDASNNSSQNTAAALTNDTNVDTRTLINTTTDSVRNSPSTSNSIHQNPSNVYQHLFAQPPPPETMTYPNQMGYQHQNYQAVQPQSQPQPQQQQLQYQHYQPQAHQQMYHPNDLQPYHSNYGTGGAPTGAPPPPMAPTPPTASTPLTYHQL